MIIHVWFGFVKKKLFLRKYELFIFSEYAI
jgi:hypothetical protein